ncbi:MAG: cell wall hydrolase [Tardiphaga sp.]
MIGRLSKEWSDDEGIFVKGPGRILAAFAVVALPLLVSACSQTSADLGVKSMVAPRSHGYSARDKECLMRAMFFESNRSSRDGLISVGTVVMNRLRSGKHGNSICEVVGAPRQFAPGVMTRPMNSKALPDVEAAAEAVLKGERNAKIKNSMYFHTAGLKFKYKNMHYTVVAGGNAFYERRNRNGDPVVLPAEGQSAIMLASAELAATPPELQAKPGAIASAASTATTAPATAPTQTAAATQTATATSSQTASSSADSQPATSPTTVANAAPVLVADARPVKKARVMMSSRGDSGSAFVVRAPRQPAVSEQPATVAMAMNGSTPSMATSDAAPFPNADETTPDAQPTAGDPVLPAVTEAVPVPATQVAAAGAADGWSAGEPAAPVAEAPVTALSFDVEQSDADAIGAMIVSEERPAMGFN